MQFEVITIFPEMISDYKKVSIIARAISKKLISIREHNLRSFAKDARQTVDDRPYGGGFGMVLRPDVMQKSLSKFKKASRTKTRILLMTPQGKVFNQKEAKRLAKYDRLVFVCGRYEGFDERIIKMVDEEVSIGDYVLMGGELPALVMIETISRFVAGVVGKNESVSNDTFSSAGKNTALLEHPQYTRPEVLKVGAKNLRVPKVLLSGNHQKIAQWRAEEAMKKTKKRRPDLMKSNDK